MAYDDGARRHPDGYGPPDDAGLATGTDYGDPAGRFDGDYRTDDYRPDADAPGTANDHYAPAEPDTVPLGDRLDHVYDEVGARSDGNDRLLVHIVLEVVLMLAAGGVLFAAYQSDAAPFQGDGLKGTLLTLSVVLLVATGTALTMRVRAVHLGLFAYVWAGAAMFAKLVDDGHSTLTSAAAVGLAVTGAGLLLALAVLLLKVPSWAASIGIGFLLYGGVAWVGVPDATPAFTTDLTGRSLIVFAVAAGISIAGGVVGALPATRRLLGACRDTAPAGKRTRGAITLTLFALIGSSFLAAVAGVVLALSMGRGASLGGDAKFDVFVYTGLALAAAALGGTSANGRRGGFLGTMLASFLLVALSLLAQANEWDIHPAFFIGGGLAAGLIVTRLVEAFGGPDEPPEHHRATEPDGDDFGSWR